MSRPISRRVARPGRRERHPHDPARADRVVWGRFAPVTASCRPASPASTSCSITIDTLRADARRRLRPARRGDPLDRSAGVRRRALHQRARAQRRHAALPREHPLGPAPDRTRGPRQRRVPLPDHRSTRSPRSSRRAATATGAFVSAFPLDSRFGLARGFDEYDDRFADAARPAFLVQERSGPETVASARRWIDSRRGRAVVLLGASLRTALSVRAAGSPRLPIRDPLPRRRQRGRRGAPAAAGADPRRRPRRADARRVDIRSRRVARRARRSDARRLRLRGRAQGAADRLPAATGRRRP